MIAIMKKESLAPLFRLEQYKVLSYRAGKMAVLAAPGSGKTTILAHLAASLLDKRLSKRDIAKGREILVVTLTNAAVHNFQDKFSTSMQIRGLSTEAGYRIRTLHGLSHDIVRENPASLRLADNFLILDGQTQYRIIRQIVRRNLQADSTWLEEYTGQDYVAKGVLPKQAWWQYITQLCVRFMRHCKDYAQSAGDLAAASNHTTSALLRFCMRVYDEYQRVLMYQGAVDFDDLVAYALAYLQEDESNLAHLAERWPYILEDEAQDSSRLQEQLLRMLSGDKNWVRAGDVNQAIHTTFTTADPSYLSAFASEPDVAVVRLEQSGRFGRPVGDLANALQKWVVFDYPALSARTAFDLLEIAPLEPGDRQQQPRMTDIAIHIHHMPGVLVSSDEELRLVLHSLHKWLPDHQEKTVAILVPDNARGFAVANLLRQQAVPYEEMLHSTSSVRAVVGVLCIVLEYMAAPSDSARFQQLYRAVWRPYFSNLADELAGNRIEHYLARHRFPEQLLYPLNGVVVDDVPADLYLAVNAFCEYARQLLALLPYSIDELLVVLGRKLFREPFEIMLCYRLGQIMLSIQAANPAWGVSEMIEEIRAIGNHQREYLADDDLRTGYIPRSGVVTVTTIHMAKGLEWDRVYLTGVNNLSFPSFQPGDRYLGSKWFVRDGLDLEAEMIAQVSSMVNLDEHHVVEEGVATQNSQAAYVSERLRLLYVGITRSRQELIILWNTGKNAAHGELLQPALPLLALQSYLDGTLIF